MNEKIDTFFELLRAIYGAAKYESQYPDKTHEEAAKIMWGALIDGHTEAELRGALDHAQRMASNGEKDWQWLNIGMILSGAKLGRGAHKPFLIEHYSDEDKARLRELGKKNCAKILEMLNDGKKNDNKKQSDTESDTDFGF